MKRDVVDQVQDAPSRRDLIQLTLEQNGHRMLLCPVHLAAYLSCEDDVGVVTLVTPAIGHCAACEFLARSARRDR